MKKTFVKEIKEKDRVTDCFIVTKKDLGISKSGKPYLNLRLMDRTGEVEARVWDDVEAVGKGFDRDDVVMVNAYAVSYAGGLQLNVSGVERVAEENYTLKDFLPTAQREPGEMMNDLDAVVSGMKDRHIKALLTAIFKDQEVRRRFMIAPAAKAMHHPYIGGLIEHVLSMCSLVDRITDHYAERVKINKDLLMAGAILHDIGKIYELKYDRAFEYTDEGRLLGHITMGVELVGEKVKEVPEFPKETSVLLKHMLLSHHGHLEFGSPKRPKTLEAIILYYLDDLDAKVAAVSALIAEEGEAWTPYQRLLERPIYKGGRPNEEPPAEEKEEKKPGGDEELELFKKLTR